MKELVIEPCFPEEQVNFNPHQTVTSWGYPFEMVHPSSMLPGHVTCSHTTSFNFDYRLVWAYLHFLVLHEFKSLNGLKFNRFSTMFLILASPMAFTFECLWFDTIKPDILFIYRWGSFVSRWKYFRHLLIDESGQTINPYRHGKSSGPMCVITLPLKLNQSWLTSHVVLRKVPGLAAITTHLLYLVHDLSHADHVFKDKY